MLSIAAVLRASVSLEDSRAESSQQLLEIQLEHRLTTTRPNES